MTHGDIKPGNLLIRDCDRQLKLTDLGLAKLSGENSKEVMATPMYVAPEVISGLDDGSPSADIYSFGVMFYELFAGTPPFCSEDVDELLKCHLCETPSPLFEMNPEVPRELAGFIDSMLEKNPANRPAGWGMISGFLEEFKKAPDKKITEISSILHRKNRLGNSEPMHLQLNHVFPFSKLLKQGLRKSYTYLTCA
jgi:serine/threonine-protein kinase